MKESYTHKRTIKIVMLALVAINLVFAFRGPMGALDWFSLIGAVGLFVVYLAVVWDTGRFF